MSVPSLILIVLCYIVTVFIFLNQGKKNTPQKPPAPTLAYDVLMGILDERISFVIKKRYDEYRLNEIQIIPDDMVKDELREIVMEVMSSLNDPFLDDLQYFHPREFIIHYTSTHAVEFFMTYTKKYKFKTK